jgi:hypothetical protein
MRFIGKQIGKSNKSTMLIKLESNIHDEDAPPSVELTMLRSQRIPFI